MDDRMVAETRRRARLAAMGLPDEALPLSLELAGGVGAVPLYLKTDSMGEFIWDFDWAAWSNRRPIPYREPPG